MCLPSGEKLGRPSKPSAVVSRTSRIEPSALTRNTSKLRCPPWLAENAITSPEGWKNGAQLTRGMSVSCLVVFPSSEVR